MLKTILIYILCTLFYGNVLAQISVDFNEHIPKYFNSNIVIEVDEEIGKYGRLLNETIYPDLNNMAFKDEISFAMWIKPRNLRFGSTTLFGSSKDFYLRTMSSGSLQFIQGFQKRFTTPKLLDANTWQQICFTVSRNRELNIYLNSSLILQRILPNDINLVDASLMLCNDHLGNKYSDPFNHFYLSNRAISSDEVAMLYNETKVKVSLETGWLAYYSLNGELSNRMNPKQKAEYKSVQLLKDTAKGRVSDFTAEQAQIMIPSIAYDNQLTLSVWTKLHLPQASNIKKNAIVGSNEFALMLKFTEPERIMFNIPLKAILNIDLKNVNYADWNHIAMTLQFNDTACFYLNGVLIGKHPIYDKSQPAAVWTLGKTFWSDQFNGEMAGFSFWNRTLSPKEINDVYKGNLKVPNQNRGFVSITISIACALVVLILLVFFYKRKSKASLVIKKASLVSKKNALYFFSEFKAYDRKGENISAEFTPRLVQLLSAILLYEVRYNEGIRSTQLSQIVWNDDDDKKRLKANRNSNIARLKKVLEKIDFVDLVYQDQYWYLKVQEGSYIDLLKVVEQLDKEQILAIRCKSGKVCKEIMGHGFDELRASLNTFFIEKSQFYCQKYSASKAYPELLNIAGFWLSVDDLSIEALKYKLTSLVHLKKQRDAKLAYDKFVTNYQNILNEDIDFDLSDLIK